MKKLLSLMMLMLLCTSAWAKTSTLTFTKACGGTGTADDGASWTVTSDAEESNFDNTKGIHYGTGKQAVSYLKLTTNSISGTITEVKVNASGASETSAKLDITIGGQAFGEQQNLTSSATEYEFTGSAQGEILVSLTQVSAKKALYVKSIAVTYDTGSDFVATPVITFDPAAPYQGDVVTCTITCATDDASIQYSTDGQTYSDYADGGFTLTADATVYAKATLGEHVSEAQKSITFTPITTVANIAALNQLADGTVFRMTGSATVVYTDASKHIYIKDDTGYTLLYNSHDAADKGYTVSNIVGTVSIYKGLFEAKETDFDVEVGDTQVDPTVMTIPNIAATNMNQYVKLENVSITAPVNQNFTITDADKNTLQGRDNFSLQDFPNDVTDDKKFDIEGFVGIYNGTIQFYPTKFTDVTPAAPFAITVNPVAGTYTKPVTVEISTTGLAEGEEATITYTIGDGEQQTYTEPFTLYKSATITVMAECGEKSDIQEYTYNIELPALAFEMTPAPGTYRGEQNVTIACTNAVSDLTVVWVYTPEEGNPIEGDETNMTFTAAKSGVLTIMAQEANTSREYNTPDEGLTYTITEPLVIDGMIVFADNEAGDATSNLDSNGVIELINDEGRKYIKSVSDIDKVYAGATGLKFSSGSGGGTMTLNLANKWNATKISFIAKNWASSNGTYDKAKMSVYGNTFDLTDEFNLYEVTLTEPQQIEAITFVATNRAYLKVINIEGEFYRITVDNAGGAYKGRADVKATLEPELEGATLTYTFAEDGATETLDEQPYPEAGVTVLKSGKLTFIARNGGTELARWEGNYTITPLIGDVNGDGKVDVGDVNYVVNIILGKINPNE